MKTRETLSRMVTYISSLIIVLIVITPPLVYLCISYQHMVGGLETKGRISAIAMMKIISLNPDAWEYQKETLQGELSGYLAGGYGEQWRILNKQNEMIAGSLGVVEKPFIARSFDLTNAGAVVGRLEIAQSVRPLVVKVATIALFMLPLGVGAFLALVYLPIRRLYRADEALMKSRQMLEKTFASLRDAIFIIDYDTGKIIDCNHSAMNIFGYARDEMLNQALSFLHISEKESMEFWNLQDSAIREKGFLFLPEVSMKRKDGTIFPAEYSMHPIKDEQGNMIGWVCVVRDITNRKIMEEEFRRAQKLESLGILASGIAHDFNNLMTGILGNISLIKSCPVRPDRVCEIPAMMEKAAFRTKDLTRQLLTFSKGGNPVTKLASMVEITQDAADFAVTGSNVRCEFSIPEDIQGVKVDEGQISQVISNIVLNAIQAMPDGGTIEISFQNMAIPENNIMHLKAGDYVRTSIRDHGVGIRGEYLAKLFDPYFTTKQEGRGLGLATAYSIIRKHEGHISVESQVGIGTTFHIYLPAVKGHFDSPALKEGILTCQKGKILLMDDSQVVRDAANLMLSRIGYNVVFAQDGSEAIALYKEALQSGEPYDVVILDLTVPGGMGGKEAVKKLLEIDPRVNAIVSSGYSEDSVMSAFKEYGFKGILEKPYRMEDLSKILSESIEARN